MTAAPTLYFFQDQADVERFARRAIKAYAAMLDIAQQSGLALDDWRHAILLNRLVIRMLKHRSDRAAELIGQRGESMADIDREMMTLWPLFEGTIETDLTLNLEIMDELTAALGKRPPAEE